MGNIFNHVEISFGFYLLIYLSFIPVFGNELVDVVHLQ